MKIKPLSKTSTLACFLKEKCLKRKEPVEMKYSKIADKFSELTDTDKEHLTFFLRKMNFGVLYKKNKLVVFDVEKTCGTCKYYKSDKCEYEVDEEDCYVCDKFKKQSNRQTTRLDVCKALPTFTVNDLMLIASVLDKTTKANLLIALKKHRDRQKVELGQIIKALWDKEEKYFVAVGGGQVLHCWKIGSPTDKYCLIPWDNITETFPDLVEVKPRGQFFWPTNKVIKKLSRSKFAQDNGVVLPKKKPKIKL